MSLVIHLQYTSSVDEYQRNLRGNIKKLYALSITNGGAFFALPIFVLFYQENDLSLAQIFLTQAVYSIGVVVLEIPSGYFSDHFGRKPTLIIATLFWFLGYLVYALSGTFGGFIVAELLIAVGASFLSGTTDALAYDSLLELKEEDRYRSVASHQSFLHFASEGIISVLGGLIALVSLRMTFVVTLPFLALGFLIALTFQEPKRHRIQETQHLKKIWNVCTHTLIRSAPLRSIILLWAIVSTMSLTLFWLTQPFELMVEVPLVWFGVVHGVIVFAGAIASKCTPFLARWMDDRLLMLLIAGAVAVSYLALGFVTTLYGLAFFFVVRIAWSLLTPLTSDLINRMTTSDVRATTLSMRSFLGRIIFAISSPFIGAMMDTSSLPETMLIVGLIGSAVLGLLFLLMRPVWKQIPA